MYDRNLKSTTRYTTQDGLPSNVIYRIEEDPKGHMWISTTNGLAVLNPVNQEIKVFKKEHGLLSNQFNYNSSLKAKDGKLYFGTLKGLVRFHPDNIQQFSIQPKIYMTQINYSDPDHNLLRQKDITFKKGITLEHNQSTFYIDYTSLSYQAPNLTQYAYCMEGLSSKWYHVVGENRVYFTKLPPGNYTFKVKAANLSGIWNDEPAMFQITILPPWWLSTKALILYGIIAIGCVVLLIFIISRHNKANIQQKIQEFENEKEKELYQAKIDFFINIAHEIRTPLTLIKSPLEKVTRDIKLSPSAKNYLTIVDKNANRLLDLVNQLLDFRKTEIEGYKLNFIHTDIIALMQETFERFHDTAEQEALQMIIECNVKSFYAFIDKEACTKADEKFLKKLNDIIDSHINDVNLDVDMIADLMNLSRPTLYRKINGLSNVTPNELIKISRLKKAAELILQGDMRIYEIAEAVGFNSQSYFSRAFSKQFNMSPSQYAKENNIELK
ncbi:MAG: helix-turn-helix domain-containing protein [Parabacteroides distasonis]